MTDSNNSSSSSSADPLGFVTNPPSAVVKIQGTARADINGKLGIVVQYATDRGRYLVHLTSSQQIVAMKADNVVKANYFEMAKAQLEQIQNDEQVRRMLTTVSSRVPPGVSLKHVGMAALVLVLVIVYLLGISRTMMLLSMIMVLGMVIGPDIIAGADRTTVLRNAPNRFQTLVREQFPGGQYIADKPYATTALAAIMLVFFVKSMMPPAAAAAAKSGSMTGFDPSSSSSSSSTMPNRALTKATLEEYYKLGFDDATASNEYGTSLPEELPPQGVRGIDNDDYADFSMPPQSTGSMFGKVFSFTNAMSIMFIGRTIMEMGRNQDGAWDLQLLVANIRTMEPLKMGLLGLSVFRLVSALMS